MQFLSQPSFIISTLSTLILFLHFPSPTTAQQCFFPNGSAADHYTPCNSSASATTCCAGGAACLSSGLCYLIYDMSINTGACTDKSWHDPNCFQKCPSGIFSPPAFVPLRVFDSCFSFYMAESISWNYSLRNWQPQHPIPLLRQPMVLLRRRQYHILLLRHRRLDVRKYVIVYLQW